MPTITINYPAVIVCVVVGMPLGYLWFGPLFGAAWAKRMDMAETEPPGGAAMVKSLLLYALGSLLIAYVLAHLLEVYRPSVWEYRNDPDPAGWVFALCGAFFVWLGFFLPLQIGRVAWEKRGWGLVAINSSFDFVRLLIFAMILAHWR